MDLLLLYLFNFFLFCLRIWHISFFSTLWSRWLAHSQAFPHLWIIIFILLLNKMKKWVPHSIPAACPKHALGVKPISSKFIYSIWRFIKKHIMHGLRNCISPVYFNQSTKSDLNRITIQMWWSFKIISSGVANIFKKLLSMDSTFNSSTSESFSDKYTSSQYVSSVVINWARWFYGKHVK